MSFFLSYVGVSDFFVNAMTNSVSSTLFYSASGIYPYHTHDALEAQSPPNWAALESSGMSREYIAFTQRLMNLTAEHRPSAAEACNDPWLQG